MQNFACSFGGEKGDEREAKGPKAFSQVRAGGMREAGRLSQGLNYNSGLARRTPAGGAPYGAPTAAAAVPAAAAVAAATAAAAAAAAAGTAAAAQEQQQQLWGE